MSDQEGICHRCGKEIVLNEKQIKFMVDNNAVLFPAWVCDECLEKDGKRCWACQGDGQIKRGRNTRTCHLCNGSGEIVADIQEIKKIFHDLWGRAEDTPDYDKEKWTKLQRLLWNKDILV